MEGELIDNKKCYNCGKSFRTPTELARHKKRKTPCLILEVKPEDKLNPLRCIYCNRISSKSENLTKHLKTCKIKNGGLDKLHDKVRHDEQLRILREEHARELKAEVERAKAEVRAEFVDQLDEMRKEFFSKMDSQKQQVVTGGNVINNNGVVNINNITVNNYTEPNYDHLLTFEKFNATICREFARLPVALACDLYFDPKHPENISVHLVSKKTGEMIVMLEGSWRTMNIDEVSKKMRAVGYEIARQGIEKFRERFRFGDSEYLCGNILQNVHHPLTTIQDLDDIKGKIQDGRNISGVTEPVISELRKNARLARGLKTNTNEPAQIHPGDNIAE